MATYRNMLPQLGDQQFLTDGGLETTLIFDDNLDLPEFAAFPLLSDSHGRQKLEEYYLSYLNLAQKKGLGFILESPTWRASRDWGVKLGLTEKDLRNANIAAINFLADLRRKYANKNFPIVISGCMGPRGDGYHIDTKMSPVEARDYHATQIATFAETEADLISAFTLNYVEEAVGITLAAAEHSIPAVISFTVETDGRLPSGQPLGSAIEEVDMQTGHGPAYFMINCAHPSHFSDALRDGKHWLERIYAVRANASCKSHAELDEATSLDRGNPNALADEYRDLKTILPHFNVFGGCCGTDINHITTICEGINA